MESLKDIFCQDRAIGLLQRAFAADRCAHAYIFAGLDGVGRHKTAREWAKLLLCEAPRTEQSASGSFADSCGSCQSCVLFEGDSHADYAHVYKELLEFTKDGKNRKTPIDLPIDVIREFLIEKASIRPSFSKRRVFVVSEAEKLNPHSQNALLKVLEEPPHYCTVILECTRLERLLPTTKSRCQIIRFGPIDEDRIVSKLTEMALGRPQAAFFARLAQGSLGLACQWAQLELDGAALFETKRTMVTSLAHLALADALNLADQWLADAKRVGTSWARLDTTVSKSDISRRAQKTVIQIFISAFHDTMTSTITPARPLINSDQAQPIAELAQWTGPEQAARAIRDGYEALRWIDANVNERLVFERLLLRLAPSAIMGRRC